MKSFFTIIALCISIASIVLIFFDQNSMATVILLPAFLLIFADIVKYTSKLHLILGFSILTFWGYLLSINVHNYLFLGAFVAMGISGFARLFFIKTFSYSKYKYFELIVGIISIGFVIANLYLDILQWQFHSQAVVPVVFSIYTSYGILNNAKQLNTSNQRHTGKIIGKKAPNFSLKDQNDELVNLSDFNGERHLLLIFVRGDWCPFCHMILRTYFKNKEKFAEKNIMVMAIGPDPVGVNRKMVENLGLDYKVLSDDKLKTATQYGIQLPDYQQIGATEHEEGMPLPASFLVDKQGIIRYTSSSDKVGEFLDPSLIFPIVDKL